MGDRQLLAAWILGGHRLGIRTEPATLLFFDLDTRTPAARSHQPLNMDQTRRPRGARPC